MSADLGLTAPRLRAPRAAAIAGILFSVLLIVSFVLLRRSVPGDPLEAGAWLHTRAGTVSLALNLVPFAGIAFLGYGLALVLLLSGRQMEGVLLVFPLWVLLVSLYILASNMRAGSSPGPGGAA